MPGRHQTGISRKVLTRAAEDPIHRTDSDMPPAGPLSYLQIHIPLILQLDLGHRARMAFPTHAGINGPQSHHGMGNSCRNAAVDKVERLNGKQKSCTGVGCKLACTRGLGSYWLRKWMLDGKENLYLHRVVSLLGEVGQYLISCQYICRRQVNVNALPQSVKSRT